MAVTSLSSIGASVDSNAPSRQHHPQAHRSRLLSAGLLTACTGGRDQVAPTGSPPAVKVPSASAAPNRPQRNAAYHVLSGEVEPTCKVAAVAAMSAALTWRPGERGLDLPVRLRRIGCPPALATDMQPLVDDHLSSIVEIIYPQYGGLGDRHTEASVMLVARQTWEPAHGRPAETRELTLDMRLRRSGRRWIATRALVPTLPKPAVRLDADAGRLLRNDAVVLPAAAQADVRGDVVDPRVIRLLEALSRSWRVHVQVLKSGHPNNVYGTRRLSNHTLGQAVDVWAIDDMPIVAHRRSVCSAVMREASRLQADKIGGPIDVDGRAGRPPYFTNDVHKDHVHVGFEAR